MRPTSIKSHAPAHWRHTASLFLLCLTALVFAAPTAHAAGKELSQRSVRVAFPEQTGMSNVGESGDLTGYNHAYLQVLAEYAGWNLTYITYEGESSDDSILQAMQQVQSGEADLIGPMLYSDAAAEILDFSANNYGIVYTTLCALEKSSLNSVNLDKYAPLRVAVYTKAATRNQEVREHLEQLDIAYELVECNSTEEQLAALQQGRADVLSSITLSYFEGTRSVASFAPRPYYFATTKGNSALIEELDAAIEALNASQPHLQEQLQQKYFGDTSGGFVLTDDEQAYLDEMPTLQVLCLPNYAPFVSETADGQAAGMLVSLMNDFALDNGITIHYTFCDSPVAVVDEWQTGQYDCLLGLPLAPEFCAANNMIRTESVLSVSMGLFFHPQTSKLPAESSIAVYRQQAEQLDLDDYASVQLYDHPGDCVLAVENGEADYGCIDRLSLEYLTAELDLSLVCTPLLSESQDEHLIVSRATDSRFLGILNKYIHTLPDSTATTYLSDASRHEYENSLGTLIQEYPLQTATLVALAIILLLSSVLFAFTASINRKKNLELQKANSAKSDFLSRMSHDIRTPLNAILGFAELAKQDSKSPGKLHGDLERISASGEFLLGLVNDILDMAKIESRAMELHPQPYPKQAFAGQIEALIRPLCEKKSIEFVVNLSDNLPDCLCVDKLRYNQIFFNLLSNAVKFTPEHGKVELLGELIGRHGELAQVRFVVRDNGVGMSEAFQQKMFESFSQERQHISGQEGSGLGLSIVKSLVEMMQGSITVHSRLGEGSEFIVQFSAAVCEVPAPQAANTPEPPTLCLKGRTILLCEDHPINTQLACRLLERVEARVVCAANGQEGVDCFAASAPGTFDAILMDIRMPVMDGIEATRAIRSLPRADAKSVSIIAMTANAFEEDVQKCLSAGMNAHLAKPFAVSALYDTLAAQIDGL